MGGQRATKVTDQHIGRMRPGDKLSDDVVPGLFIRHQGRRRMWAVRYRFRGKNITHTLGRYTGDLVTAVAPGSSVGNHHEPFNIGGELLLHIGGARIAALRIKELAQKGVDPRVAAELPESPTVNQLADLYLERHAKRHKKEVSWREDQRMLANDVTPRIGHLQISEVTRKHIIGVIDAVMDRGAPVAANRTLAVLSKMFNYAVERALIDVNPVAGVKAPAPEAPRERVLSESEIKTFWTKLTETDMPESLQLALKLILVTGQRPGEVAGASVSEFGGAWWTIPEERTKNKSTHRVPLSDLAQKLVTRARQLAGDSQWLFPASRGGKPIDSRSLSHALAPNRAVLGIHHFTPHDLRRTCGTMLGALGFPRWIQDKVLNHKDRSVGGIYDL